VATNQSGRANWSVIEPPSDAVTVTERLHVFPWSSLTTISTASPGAQFAPFSVTVSPGL
jgi:hypothetical protein